MTRVPTTPRPQRNLRARLTTFAIAAGLILAPAGGMTLAVADELAPTTPEATTPEGTTPTTPEPTTPPVDPATLTLDKPATRADISWEFPPSWDEEQKVTIRARGTTDGQLTYHAAFLTDIPNCPVSPLYPRQVATGSKITVKPVSGTGTGTTPAAGTVDHSASITPKDSGGQRFCAWVLSSPAANEASTLARVDLALNVASRPAELRPTVPDTVRSGDYFTVTLAGRTAASGRRALVMADPEKGQNCAAMRKSTSKSRGLQSVIGVASGEFSKTSKLRFKGKTAGSYRLCIQIVEAGDRNPEAVFTKVVTVTEQMKCVATQTALTQRRADLTLIRQRRDSAKKRVTAARKKAAPVRKRVATMRKASNKRISNARKAVRKAKSPSGRKKASRRLASVRRAEAKKLYRAEAPLRKLNAQVRMHDRTYKQYRTGANLLQQTIDRTKRDAKKYCAKP